jgi:hypothetical protein
VAHDHPPLLDPIPADTSPFVADQSYSKIVTPYSANAFEIYLAQAGVSHLYPHLPAKIASGFPLGPIPLPSVSYTPENLSSLNDHVHIAQEWVESEISLGRMEGPFSKEELEAKIGPFISSPLQMVVKTPYPGAPSKSRTCVNLSYKGPGHDQESINGFIDSDEMQTRWGLLQECAHLVGHSFLSFIFIHSFLFF